jgi:hypothetical protein
MAADKTVDLLRAIATVNADANRPVLKADCWSMVGALCGISGACAAQRARIYRLGDVVPARGKKGHGPAVRWGAWTPK